MAEWRDILSAPGVGLTYGTRSMVWLGRMMLVPILPLFIQSLLPESAQVSTFTGLVVGVAAIAGMASAVYLGRLSDRVGHRRVLVGSALVGGLFYLLQAFVTEAWQLLALQAVAGAAIGGINPTLSAMLSGYTQSGQEGAVYGLDSSVMSASRVAAPLVGAGVALWFGLSGTFFTAGLLFFSTAVMAVRWLPEYKVVAQPQTA